MEPNNPNSANTTPSYPATDPTPPKQKMPLSRKIAIIIAAVIGVILLIVGIIFLINALLGNSTKTTNTTDNKVTKTSQEIALVSKSDGPITQYNGTPIIQACSVLTLEDVRSAGLKLLPDASIGSVKRVYFDGLSQAQLLEQSEYSLPPKDEDNNYCQYYTQDGEDKGAILLTIFQPAYAKKKAMDSEVGRNYQVTGEANGITTYLEEANSEYPNTSTYILRGANVDAKLHIDISNKQAKETLVKSLAKRLVDGVNGTPVQVFSYESPLFKNKVADACSLLSDTATFKNIVGGESSPLVEELLSTIVGSVQDPENPTILHKYVERECKRRTPEKSISDKSLRLQAITYETEEAAKAMYAFESKPKSYNKIELTKDVQEVTPTIGDESFFADTPSLNNALVFRKGNIIIKMSYFLPGQEETETATQRIDKMRPFAESIAATRLSNL